MGGVESKRMIDQAEIPRNDSLFKLSSEPSDWSDLPQDILRLISTKLTSLYDVVHLRIICKNWCLAISLPLQLPRPPWIFLDDDCIPKTLQFYSLDPTECCIDLPEAEGMQLVGTTYNSMVVLDENKNTMFVVNPITRKIDPLPPFAENYPRAHHIGVDPILSKNMVVIRLKLSHKSILLLCKLGDKEWKAVQVPYLDYGCAYYNGMYYINKGATSVIDLSTGETALTIPPPLEMPADQRFSYLIECFGELFGVWKNKLWCSSIKEYRFEVFRLENRNQETIKWDKMTSIGDRILFLNTSTGFCFEAGDFPGFKENCIYFTSAKCLPGPVRPGSEFFNVCRYNIRNGKTEELKSIDSILAYWSFPSLQ